MKLGCRSFLIYKPYLSISLTFLTFNFLQIYELIDNEFLLIDLIANMHLFVLEIFLSFVIEIGRINHNLISNVHIAGLATSFAKRRHSHVRLTTFLTELVETLLDIVWTWTYLRILSHLLIFLESLRSRSKAIIQLWWMASVYWIFKLRGGVIIGVLQWIIQERTTLISDLWDINMVVLVAGRSLACAPLEIWTLITLASLFLLILNIY